MKSPFNFGFRISDFGFRAGESRQRRVRLPFPIRNPKSEIRNRRGAALVEFSLVLPLLMLLLLGVMEFGMIMHDFLTLAHSVREGVRSAAIGKTADEVRQQVHRAPLPGLQDDMVYIR